MSIGKSLKKDFGLKLYRREFNTIYQLKKKYDFYILDLYNDEAIRAVSQDDYQRYMKDKVHPTLLGYREWCTHKLHKQKAGSNAIPLKVVLKLFVFQVSTIKGLSQNDSAFFIGCFKLVLHKYYGGFTDGGGVIPSPFTACADYVTVICFYNIAHRCFVCFHCIESPCF